MIDEVNVIEKSVLIFCYFYFSFFIYVYIVFFGLSFFESG